MWLESGMLMDVCDERDLSLENTSLQQKLIPRYKWTRVNERSLIGYIGLNNRLK